MPREFDILIEALEDIQNKQNRIDKTLAEIKRSLSKVPQWIKPKEASTTYGISISKIRTLMADGTLVHKNVTNGTGTDARYLISTDSIIKYLNINSHD